ncbi:4a-hydroxytetrahydrobiopterin dehydratase [Rhizobiaceae bacterium BDR2-2]|uniref:Putative pterin-4-alpha-carbinolamine dehydratase n=1 Tax=Ectorhizobium quercum TaxID=2965071 RepID=A0AAE3N6B2_9HYPH|nr:4a-hydroxytetrahydrobiopterin dehydratase [Ectorhizobium quercum]MCX8999332.1 4a-hydroxytetrahydrobiopterin dehydratase [Ectorhizobium quercum]
MKRQRLEEAEVWARLGALPGWERHDDGRSIVRSLKFRDFSEAFAFMTRTAMQAEKLDHHPEWSNVWSRVDITLSTHSAGGLTELDFELAAFINAIAGPAD